MTNMGQVTDNGTRPVAKTHAERNRNYRQTLKYKETRARYRRGRSKWATDAAYLSRPVIAFDGEGITRADGSHAYIMLAAMDSDEMEYRSVYDPDGLSTVTCLRFILDIKARNPNAICIIYGGSYDFNMIIGDLTRDDALALYQKQSHKWRGYRLAWRRGKSFTITDYSRTPKQTATLFDVVSFFQRPFVTACDEYLGDAFEDREMIVANKAHRSSFALEDANTMAVYNAAELRNLIALFVELRARLNAVNLRPKRWDGPGAVAAALMMREEIQEARKACPDAVATAARHAYAGGRFECLKFGHVEKPAWEYDLNSAYPAALLSVPNLVEGYWKHGEPADSITETFSLIRVSWRAHYPDLPGPVFHRAENGTIFYPTVGTNWIWRPEYDTLVEYCKRGLGEFSVLESWQFHEYDDVPKPFAFVEPLYRQRQALKAAKDGAQVGIKLALNSLYGKLAQQVGAHIDEETGEWIIPPFHTLEWAGYTTSYCRARVLRACLDDLDAVIAFETDALFTTREIDVPISEALGDFDCTPFADLTYVQSGLYFGTKTNGEIVEKTRGVDRAHIDENGNRVGGMNRTEVVRRMSAKLADDRKYPASLTRFVTLGLALSQDFARWRRWETMPKSLTLQPTGKRIHIGCGNDASDNPYVTGVWHSTICPIMPLEPSHEFPVLWANPNPEMTALAELREAEHYYE